MPARRTQRHPEDQEKWGRRLKGLMAEHDLKTKDVAKALNWTTSNVGHYLTGRNRLRREDLPGFATALKVSLPFLVRRLEFDYWTDIEEALPGLDRPSANTTKTLDTYAFDRMTQDLRQIYAAGSFSHRQAILQVLGSLGCLLVNPETPAPEPVATDPVGPVSVDAAPTPKEILEAGFEFGQLLAAARAQQAEQERSTWPEEMIADSKQMSASSNNNQQPTHVDSEQPGYGRSAPIPLAIRRLLGNRSYAVFLDLCMANGLPTATMQVIMNGQATPDQPALTVLARALASKEPDELVPDRLRAMQVFEELHTAYNLQLARQEASGQKIRWAHVQEPGEIPEEERSRLVESVLRERERNG